MHFILMLKQIYFLLLGHSCLSTQSLSPIFPFPHITTKNPNFGYFRYHKITAG